MLRVYKPGKLNSFGFGVNGAGSIGQLIIIIL